MLPACVCAPLSPSQEAQWGGQEAGPAEEEHMSQSSGHHAGPAEPQLGPQRQRRQPGRAHTALPELLRSVSVPACLNVPKVCHVPSTLYHSQVI